MYREVPLFILELLSLMTVMDWLAVMAGGAMCVLLFRGFCLMTRRRDPMAAFMGAIVAGLAVFGYVFTMAMSAYLQMPEYGIHRPDALAIAIASGGQIPILFLMLSVACMDDRYVFSRP